MLLSKNAVERELDEELAYHLELEIEKNLRAGMTREEARRRATIAFGGVERYKEQVREARRLGWMSSLAMDVRLAVRSLARTPGFAVVALLTIALGIGANTAMFSFVNGILLRPLPYPQPEQLVRLYQANPEQGIPDARISFLDLEDWRERTRSFAEIAGYLQLPQVLTGRGDPLEIRAAYVTEGFFEVVGGSVQLGRALTEEDNRLAQRAAVISDRLWRSSYFADPEVVGESLLLRGQLHTIVGVAPSSLRLPTAETDVWMPYSILTETEIGPRVRDSRILDGLARLGEGVGLETAQADVAAVARQLAVDYSATNAGWSGATVVPLKKTLVGDVDTALLVVLGVVAFILLIACANLANLLLARGTTRSREVAIRTALGAGQGRIVRQFLTESLVLALLGGLLGLVLSLAGVELVKVLSAETLPRIEDVRLDGRVFVFGLLLSGTTGTLFGLLPALRTARIDPHESLRGGRGSIGDGADRLRGVLVVAQVTLAVVLMIGAGLMARSFLGLRNVEPGFDPEGVITVRFQLNIAGVEPSQVVSHIFRRREEIVEGAAALPGVVAVGVSNAFPFQDEPWEVVEFRRAGDVDIPDLPQLRADLSYVSEQYFDALGVPLLRGDPLPSEWPDGSPTPVLINETAAQRFWSGEDPIGQRVQATWGEAIVVGVLRDVRQLGLAQGPPPAVFFPQVVGPRLLTTLVVRASGDPLALAGPLRQLIQNLDPGQPIRSIATLERITAESIAQDRFFTVLFATFGGLASVLAALGIYGVLAYSVTQRTREIGVRIALGARTAEVFRTVVGAGMVLVASGIALGTVAALFLTRLLQGQLHGVSTTDPLAFAAAIGLLGAVALLGSYLPARRAMHVDPMVAVRAE